MLFNASGKMKGIWTQQQQIERVRKTLKRKTLERNSQNQ